MNFRWIGRSQDGKTVTLKKLEGCPISVPSYYTEEWKKQNSDTLRVGAIVDVETTGLRQSEDSIIEIAIRLFTFNRSTGEILELQESYSSFQDPGHPLSPEIIQLTGITDELLKGHNIDWKKVNELIEKVHIVVAHNARFDRPFVDKLSEISQQKVWGCSLKQIDWSRHGFSSSKLELLNIYHGFYTDSHRALNDVDALLYLLSLPQEKSQHPYLRELLENAKRPTAQIIASAAPFDSKDHLKAKGYSWDNINRFWHRFLFKDELPQEISWLEEVVYIGPFAGITRDIALQDHFKGHK